HANAGITVGGLATEFSYGGPPGDPASGHLPIIGELVGPLLDTYRRLLPVTAPHPTLRGVRAVRLTPSGARPHIHPVVPGLKWNLSNTWVLAANVTVPLTKDGLTAPFTPFVGLDYALGR